MSTKKSKAKKATKKAPKKTEAQIKQEAKKEKLDAKMAEVKESIEQKKEVIEELKQKQSKKEKKKIALELKTEKTKKIVILSILLAIELVFCFTSLGSIPIFGIPATTSHLPVIIAVLICGLPEGMLMGFVFGVCSIIVFSTTLLANPSAFVFSPWALGGNWLSAVTALLPRILFPVILFYTYKLIKKITKRTWTKSFMTAIVAIFATICHTIMVLTLFYINMKIYGEMEQLYYSFIVGAITINVFFEIAMSAIVGAVTVVRLKNVLK